MRKSLLIAAFLSLVVCSYAQPAFTPLGGPPGGNIIQMEKTLANKIFALTSQALYTSTNNGSSWSKNTAIEAAANGLANQGIVSLYIDKSDKIYVATQGHIYTSTDAGVTWTGIVPTGVYNPSKRLLKNETTGSLYILGYSTFYGLHKSTDDGLTWIDVSPVASQINDFVIKNTPSFSHIYVGPSSATIYRSVDDAQSWSETKTVSPSGTLPNGVTNAADPGMIVNKFNGNIYILLHANQGVYATTNDGTNWVDVNASSVVTFATGGNDNYGLFASETSNRVFLRWQNDLFYSDNAITGGASWSQFTLNNTDPPHTMLAGTNIFVGFYNYYRHADGILKSTNGGTSWSYADNGINEYETSSFVRADNGRLIVVNGGGTIGSSNDAGITWTKAKQCDCGFNSLIKRTNGNIVAIGDRTYLSTNDGANWSPLGTTHPDYISRVVSGDGGLTLFGIGGIGGIKIYKSVDGGENFSDLGVAIGGSPEFFQLAVDNANNLYANTSGDKAYKIVGSTATEILTANSGITTVRGVNAIGANAYLVGDNAQNNTSLSKSTNQGATWTPQEIDNAYQLKIVSDDVFFSKGDGNKIVFSNDGGGDWNVAFDIGSTLAFDLVNVFTDANGIAYVSLSNGPIYKSSSTVVAPNKPANLETVGVADKEVYLEWSYDDSGGASVDGFNIERKLISGGDFVKIGEAESYELYYIDRTTVKNTGYSYRVIADSDAGSTASDPVSVTTKDDCPLAIPDNRSWIGVVTPGGPYPPIDPVVIRKVSSDYYSISEFTAGSLNGVARIGGGTYGNSTVGTFFNDACGTPFIETKSEVYPNGNGSWDGTTLILKFQLDKGQYASTEKIISLTLNPSDPGPAIPANLSAYTIDNSKIQLQWAAGDYQQTYIIERSPDNNTAFTQVGTVNYPTLTYTDSGPFTAGKTYFYRVKAQNSTAVPSGYSSEVSLVFNTPIFVSSNTVVSSTPASAPTLAWADFDNDGFEDLIMPKLNFLSQGPVEPLLFKNTAGTDFQLLTGKLPTSPNLAGTSVGDYNNDGNLDVFITAYGLDGSGSTVLKNLLLQNDGSFNFTNVDNSIVTDVPQGESAIGGSWVDVNSNGFLDLFIPYEDGNDQQLFAGSAGGTFTANTAAGALLTDNFSKGSAFWADYDNDGDQDVFILSNDSSYPNRLYKNDAGVFTRVTGSVFDGDLDKFFTASWGDYNNDQFLDLFVGVQDGGKNYLYKNNGNGTFSKVAETANAPGENISSNNTGSAWGDVDNDGDLDLFVSSGGEPNLFYLNQGNGTFSKIENEAITGFNTEFNLGAAFADYNNDGHLDIVLGTLNFPLGGGESGILGDATRSKLYKNNTTTGNWIKMKLNGAGGPQLAVSNRAAIGARVKIVAGGKTQIREISSQTGMGAQSSLIVHFGIGAETTITSVDVRFPSGTHKTLENVAANQLLVVDEDDEGPKISAFTPENKDKGFGQYDITISANDAVQTSNVNLVYRPIGGKDFVTQGLTRVSAGQNDWKITVLEAWYDAMGMEFYFEATDPSGNKSKSPASSNYYSYLNYKDTNAPKFPTTSLVFGGTESTWNIVSIPFDLGTSATVTAVLDELGTFDDTQWRLLTYQNQTAWSEFPSSFSAFTRGKGYFLNVKTPPSAGITIADELLAPQNNQSTLFSMDLAKGWNQIGNPYLVDVKWSDVKAFNSTVTGVGDLKVYNSNGRSYGDGSTLGVYQGGFVFANEAVSGYKISFSGQTSGGRKGEAGRIASTELNNPNWRTMFRLTQSDVTFTLGGVGMNPKAKVSYDDFDDVTVPRLHDFLEMNFHHPEHFAKRFSRDVVPTQDEYTWEFTVDSNLKGNATLTWDNAAFGLNEKELYLFDIAQQKPIDMREAAAYSFDASTSNRFRVYYGEHLKAKVQPEKIVLGKAYPNPTSGITTIPFTLPQASGSYQVRLEVYDMVGRRVSILRNGMYPAGFYETEWDTSNSQLGNGLYTYRLVVSGDRKNEVYTSKIILNK